MLVLSVCVYCMGSRERGLLRKKRGRERETREWRQFSLRKWGWRFGEWEYQKEEGKEEWSKKNRRKGRDL